MNKQQHHIDIHVEEHVQPVPHLPLQQAVLATLAHLHVAQACEVVVVISDDTALQDLNRRFRGENHPTDVLSFADDARGPFSGGGAGFPRYLGDIVISIDRARIQAADADTMLIQELQLLTVHGMLHLLGYDHVIQADKAVMWALQKAVLHHLGIDNIRLPE